jgi:hypothetical protein
MSPTLIEEVFSRLYGIPCWHVQQGWGSFLTFEFGQPRQEIGRTINRDPDDRDSHSRRLVTIRGDWHLWIYCSGWQITQDGNFLAMHESTRGCIASACRTLHGQAITSLTCKTADGASRFAFDLGGRLSTAPYDDELNEQWMLYCPDGSVLIYRSDGAFSHGPSSGDDAPFQ